MAGSHNSQLDIRSDGFNPTNYNEDVQNCYDRVKEELSQTIQETQEIFKRQVVNILAIVFSVSMIVWGISQSGGQAYFCSGLGLLIALVSGLLWNHNRKLISEGKQKVDQLLVERSHYEKLLNKQ